MQNKQIKLSNKMFVTLVLIGLFSSVKAEEKIIQKEEISFEKCLKVITTSEGKLSVVPQISDVSNLKRVATFSLIDGSLTIICDGQEGTVTVSTTTD